MIRWYRNLRIIAKCHFRHKLDLSAVRSEGTSGHPDLPQSRHQLGWRRFASPVVSRRLERRTLDTLPALCLACPWRIPAACRPCLPGPPQAQPSQPSQPCSPPETRRTDKGVVMRHLMGRPDLSSSSPGRDIASRHVASRPTPAVAPQPKCCYRRAMRCQRPPARLGSRGSRARGE